MGMLTEKSREAQTHTEVIVKLACYNLEQRTELVHHTVGGAAASHSGTYKTDRY
jgi:hypothetical protein